MEDVLNGTILMILVTCTFSSLLLKRNARKLALNRGKMFHGKTHTKKNIDITRLSENCHRTIDFGLMLKPKKSTIPVYALNVVSDDRRIANKTVAKKMMEKAISQAAATGQAIISCVQDSIYIIAMELFTTLIKEQNNTGMTDRAAPRGGTR